MCPSDLPPGSPILAAGVSIGLPVGSLIGRVFLPVRSVLAAGCLPAGSLLRQSARRSLPACPPGALFRAVGCTSPPEVAVGHPFVAGGVTIHAQGGHHSLAAGVSIHARELVARVTNTCRQGHHGVFYGAVWQRSRSANRVSVAAGHCRSSHHPTALRPGRGLPEHGLEGLAIVARDRRSSLQRATSCTARITSQPFATGGAAQI